MRRTLSTLLLAAAATIVALAPPARPAVAAEFSSADFGFAEGGAPVDLPHWLDAMDAFVGERKPIVRFDLDWWYVQPEPCVPGAACQLHWDRLDPLVEAAHARGVRVLLVLAYSPPWANGHPGSGGWFPTRDADWVDIVDRTVARYAGKIQAFEVWNEPNMAHYGNYGTGTAQERKARYWRLVRLAHERVHAGCAGCVVLAGGSAYGTPSTPQVNEHESAAWLEWGYANGYAPYFDAVAHHPYPAANSGLGPSRPECTTRWWNMFGPPDPNCGELAAVRAVMLRHGDAATKIWGTEWGYPTSGTVAVPWDTIRDYVVEGVHMWRALDYTGPLFLYSYRDQVRWDGRPCDALPGNPECHFGVAYADGRPKEPIYSDLSRTVTDTWSPNLPTDRSVRRWAALRSPNGQFTLWLQADGNLALYERGRVPARWTSNTRGAVRLVNQGDGNLVLYDAADRPLWDTRTWGRGPSTLWLQDDGNLVLYRNSDPVEVTWALW